MGEGMVMLQWQGFIVLAFLAEIISQMSDNAWRSFTADMAALFFAGCGVWLVFFR